MGSFFAVIGRRLPKRRTRTPSYDEEVLCAGWNPMLDELKASLGPPEPSPVDAVPGEPSSAPDALPAQRA